MDSLNFIYSVFLNTAKQAPPGLTPSVHFPSVFLVKILRLSFQLFMLLHSFENRFICTPMNVCTVCKYKLYTCDCTAVTVQSDQM